MSILETAKQVVAGSPRPMETYTPDDGIVRLLMANDFDHPLADSAEPTWTIGFNNDAHVGEGEGVGWQIVGWDWNGDDFIQTKRGTPMGWLPFDAEKVEPPEFALAAALIEAEKLLRRVSKSALIDTSIEGDLDEQIHAFLSRISKEQDNG